MSGGRVGKDSEHPGAIRSNEPLDDIILGDDETTETPKAVAEPVIASRSERPSRAAEDISRKSVRQKLLRIPDDEVSRPLHHDEPPPPPPPPPQKRPLPRFDPESTVKMNAADLDSAQLPSLDSDPALDEDSWTPLQPPLHPKTRPEPWNPRESDERHDLADGDRSQLPTPPPTSEEIPVAMDEPTSSERIPAAPRAYRDDASRGRADTPVDAHGHGAGGPPIEPAPDSSPIGLTQRSDHPPVRKSGAPDGAAPEPAMREQMRTVLDAGELQSIDVSFQSTPNLEIADPIGTPGSGTQRAHPTSDPASDVGPPSGTDALELAAEDVQPVDSKPPTSLAGASAPPPLRAKTQSTPSIPPLRPKVQSVPPQVPPMRSKAASGPPPMRPRWESTPSVPPHTSAPGIPAALAASVAPPVPPMRPRAPSVPPGTPAGATGATPTAGVYTPQNPTPASLSLSQSGQNPAVSVAAKPPPPRSTKPLLMVPSLLNSANGLAPPSIADAAHGRNKKVHPWWEDLFNDDFIRAMEKLTDGQIKREADFIEDSLGVAQGAMVLDLACGTGRHAIELSRRGYNVVGFDLSLAMLARAADEAEERAAQLNFVQGDMREMTFEEMFDGIYCWSTSFGFFEEEKNANVISRVHRALKKGGQFLLDVVNRDYVARQSPSLVWFEGDGAICMDEMQIDWITSRMKIKRTMMIDDGRSREIEFSMRLYALHELGKLLHDAGFRVAEVSGRVATPGVFFGADSPRTIILAEKR